MKKWLFCFLISSSFAVCAEPTNIKIGTINFKSCVDESKIGKKERSTFEAMEKQMESFLKEKGKALEELANKLKNVDELELMSAEAETELNRKFRAQSQEAYQLQAQYEQTLTQANYQVVHKLKELVEKAAEKVAKANNFDLVLNDEGAFYTSKFLDISPLVVKQLDSEFEEAEGNEKSHT